MRKQTSNVLLATALVLLVAPGIVPSSVQAVSLACGVDTNAPTGLLNADLIVVSENGDPDPRVSSLIQLACTPEEYDALFPEVTYPTSEIGTGAMHGELAEYLANHPEERAEFLDKVMIQQTHIPVFGDEAEAAEFQGNICLAKDCSRMEPPCEGLVCDENPCAYDCEAILDCTGGCGVPPPPCVTPSCLPPAPCGDLSCIPSNPCADFGCLPPNPCPELSCAPPLPCNGYDCQEIACGENCLQRACTLVAVVCYCGIACIVPVIDCEVCKKILAPQSAVPLLGDPEPPVGALQSHGGFDLTVTVIFPDDGDAQSPKGKCNYKTTAKAMGYIESKFGKNVHVICYDSLGQTNRWAPSTNGEVLDTSILLDSCKDFVNGQYAQIVNGADERVLCWVREALKNGEAEAPGEFALAAETPAKWYHPNHPNVGLSLHETLHTINGQHFPVPHDSPWNFICGFQHSHWWGFHYHSFRSVMNYCWLKLGSEKIHGRAVGEVEGHMGW